MVSKHTGIVVFYWYSYHHGRIHRVLTFACNAILALLFRNRKKDELLDEEGDNKQDEASSSSANEEQNATTDCEDIDTGKIVSL